MTKIISNENDTHIVNLENLKISLETIRDETIEITQVFQYAAKLPNDIRTDLVTNLKVILFSFEMTIQTTNDYLERMRAYDTTTD